MDARLPAHAEISALIRQVSVQGGFAAVLQKGERDAGTILVVTRWQGEPARCFERVPTLDGSRPWREAVRQDERQPRKLDEYLEKRMRQDPDLWIIELDIAHAERFIGLAGPDC